MRHNLSLREHIREIGAQVARSNPGDALNVGQTTCWNGLFSPAGDRCLVDPELARKVDQLQTTVAKKDR